MQATQAQDRMSDLEQLISDLQMQYWNETNESALERIWISLQRFENELSDLRNLGRDDSEPDVTIDYEDYAQVVRDSDITSDNWVSCEYGHVNLTLTRRQHARSINVWRDKANQLMVGRMRISFSATGRPTATCTHCGLAFTCVANTIVNAECFTITCIAHGHNDGPLFARAYTISEQSHYKPIVKGNNLPLIRVLSKHWISCTNARCSCSSLLLAEIAKRK